MHISLDSALGQQRRLNSVGESITQIAPDPAAAYSLRSLTGGDPKVVRVRRASDNHEQDFTASDVSSGALVDFVNAQVVAPLDIQALSATGRDGDFLIAKAAYSLRSLGTRQATVAATGDTVARADGKFVCQVRRSSDDALKSFTADEITDGTLLSFVGTSGSDNGFVKTWYDQSVTTQAGDTATGNHATQATAASQPKIVSAGAYLGKVKFDGTDDSFDAVSISSSSFPVSVISLSSPAVTNSTIGLYGINTQSGGFYHSTPKISMFAGSRLDSSVTPVADNDFIRTDIFNGSSSSLSVNGTETTGTIGTSTTALTKFEVGNSTQSGNNIFNGSIKEIILYTSDQSDNRTAIEANIGEVYSIDLPSGVDPGFDQVDGFVETWYDQSGNGRDAVQATASKQPKIVNAGSLISNGLDFDGSDDLLELPSSLISNINSASIFVVAENESSGFTSTQAIIISTGSQSFILPAHFLNNLSFNYSSTSIALGATDTNTHLFTATAGSSNVEAFVDGTSKGTLSSSSGFSQPGTGGIGGENAGSWNGQIQEVIIYASDQTANRVAIETNINNQYSLF